MDKCDRHIRIPGVNTPAPHVHRDSGRCAQLEMKLEMNRWERLCFPVSPYVVSSVLCEICRIARRQLYFHNI